MYSTTPTLEDAKRIAHALVSEQLVACVNIQPNIISVYSWDGKVEESGEVLLMMKTTQMLMDRVTERIRQLHSYEVPESIGVRVEDEGGSRQYMDWVRDSTRKDST